MATINTLLPRAAVGALTGSRTLLTGADTFVYKPTTRQFLVIQNESASPAAIVIDGALAGTVSLPGQGATANNAAGYTVNVAAGDFAILELGQIRNYLKGDIAVTGGGADIYAHIIES